MSPFVSDAWRAELTLVSPFVRSAWQAALTLSFFSDSFVSSARREEPGMGVFLFCTRSCFNFPERRQHFSRLSRQTVYWVERPSFLQRRDITILWRRWLCRAETCSPEMIGYFHKWESLRNVFFSGRHRQQPSHNVQAETSECLHPPNNTWIAKNSKVGK